MTHWLVLNFERMYSFVLYISFKLGSLRCLVVNLLDCDIVVRGFELQILEKIKVK